MSASASSISASNSSISCCAQLCEYVSKNPPISRSASRVPRCQARKRRRFRRVSRSMNFPTEISRQALAAAVGWAISRAQIGMRPDILNPLFAEITALKGVGPQRARPLERLGLARAVDVAFHLPTGWIDRRRVDELRMADVGQVVVIALTPVDYRTGGPP